MAYFKTNVKSWNKSTRCISENFMC